MRNVLSATAIALLAVTAVSLAQSPAEAYKWGVNKRQNRQQNRIGQGLSNGSLTGKEAYRLEKQQRKLAKQESRMRASGNGLNQNERARLEHEQNHLSRNIYDQKHDGQTR